MLTVFKKSVTGVYDDVKKADNIRSVLYLQKVYSSKALNFVII